MKKTKSFLITSIMLCTMLIIPVSAAEKNPSAAKMLPAVNESVLPYTANYFSGSTGKMNSINKSQSRIFNMSSGSINSNASVTSVKVNTTVSSGSSPFYLVLKCPTGEYTKTLISKSGSVTISDFNNKNPKGTWQMYIVSTGLVSTATARMTVNYTY